MKNKDFGQQNIFFEFWQENNSTKTELWRGKNMPSLAQIHSEKFTQDKYHKDLQENTI